MVLNTVVSQALRSVTFVEEPIVLRSLQMKRIVYIREQGYLIYKKNSLTCGIQAESALSRHDQRHAISKLHFLQFQVQ